jgi:two-component system repressor protein LuxO
MAKVHLVEDAFSLAHAYKAFLETDGYEVRISETGGAALDAIKADKPLVAIVDINLPDMSGLDILRALQQGKAACEVIIITGQGSINLAVEAMREGAFDFIMKPFSPERLKTTVKSALAKAENKAKAARQPATPASAEQDAPQAGFGDFIGNSTAMREVYTRIESAAPSNATVFISGESGTGKELCARAIHQYSSRSSGPFITLNCAAIPNELLESEIFGHVKGAFTGATRDRDGAAIQAHGGTLFLDEICEMDMALQSKLLRFLQERNVQRVGDDRLREVDVRIVCATNRAPMDEVKQGRFREDLYYRLHVVPVSLPPLRERHGDVALIANSFLQRFSQEDNKAFVSFSPEAQAGLAAYDWPGNVRQLQNVVRNIVVLNNGAQVEPHMLPIEITSSVVPAPVAQTLEQQKPASHPVFEMQHAVMQAADTLYKPFDKAAKASEIMPLEEVIKTTVLQAIEACGGSVPKAAKALDVSPSTLYRRLAGWGLAPIDDLSSEDHTGENTSLRASGSAA